AEFGVGMQAMMAAAPDKDDMLPRGGFAKALAIVHEQFGRGKRYRFAADHAGVESRNFQQRVKQASHGTDAVAHLSQHRLLLVVATQMQKSSKQLQRLQRLAKVMAYQGDKMRFTARQGLS